MEPCGALELKLLQSLLEVLHGLKGEGGYLAKGVEDTV